MALKLYDTLTGTCHASHDFQSSDDGNTEASPRKHTCYPVSGVSRLWMHPSVGLPYSIGARKDEILSLSPYPLTTYRKKLFKSTKSLAKTCVWNWETWLAYFHALTSSTASGCISFHSMIQSRASVVMCSIFTSNRTS